MIKINAIYERMDLYTKEVSLIFCGTMEELHNMLIKDGWRFRGNGVYEKGRLATIEKITLKIFEEDVDIIKEINSLFMKVNNDEGMARNVSQGV